jgi:hypothetical protein
MAKRTFCKGYNKVTAKACLAWATKDGYCGPHAIAAAKAVR